MAFISRIVFRMGVPVFRGWWINHRTKILVLTIALMAFAALYRFNIEFYRLVLSGHSSGALDLKFRYREVHAWFAGHPVYDELKHALYPPASYTILWPFLGWLPIMQARWLWGASSIVMLGWLAYILVRQSDAKTTLERVFIALLPFSAYSTNMAIGNGQLIVFILPALISGLLLICNGEKSYKDALGAAMVSLTLVNPTIAAPFFWIVLFVPGRISPAILVVLGYVVLTLLAASFQNASFPSLIMQWAQLGQGGAAYGSVHGGYANLHSLLTQNGLGKWNTEGSLLLLGVLGVWVYRNRRVDTWLLIGVSAIVARLWTYHRNYNDLLIILPTIALCRIVKKGHYADPSKVLAVGLLAITWVSMLAPIRLLKSPPPWNWFTIYGLLAVWLLILLFLLLYTWREKNSLTGI